MKATKKLTKTAKMEYNISAFSFMLNNRYQNNLNFK
jgi:hypothetical protein